MNMQELDGLAADVDALFGISGLKEDLIDVAMLGGSAGVAILGWEVLYRKVDFFARQSAAVKAGAAVATGVVGGIAAARFINKSVGAGIAAGLVGWGIGKGLMMGMDKMGISLGQVSDRDLLLGAVDNDITVSDYRPIPGQTRGLGDMSVEDFTAMPGQVGQAGNVNAQDMQPMPGMHGRDGYLSALS